jgi:hypothetical protein
MIHRRHCSRLGTSLSAPVSSVRIDLIRLSEIIESEPCVMKCRGDLSGGQEPEQGQRGEVVDLARRDRDVPGPLLFRVPRHHRESGPLRPRC